MADMMFDVEPAVAPGVRRGRPKRVYRGNIRKQIRSLKRVLGNLQKADVREAARAESQGYEPALFQGANNSATARAVRSLIARCDEALAQTT